MFKIVSDISFRISLELGTPVTKSLDVNLTLSNDTFRIYRTQII